MPNALINSEQMISNALVYQDSVAMDSRVKGKCLFDLILPFNVPFIHYHHIIWSIL